MGFFPRLLPAPAPVPRLEIDWEEPACLLCGGHRRNYLIEAQDPLSGNAGLWFAVVQCQDCGLCFTSPRPDPRTIGPFYPKAYRPHRDPRRRAPTWGRLLFPARWRRSRRVPDLPSSRPGRLLEFGCSPDPFRQEITPYSIRIGAPDLSPSGVLNPEELGGSFHAILLRHALEHAHRPLLFLRQVSLLLAPKGKLLVRVPNIASLAYRWFGAGWSGLDLPRHLTHFSPWTLQRMLEQAGFDVGPIQMVRRSRGLRSSAKLSCLEGGKPHWHHWLKGKRITGLVARYSCLIDQADCLLVTAERRTASA